ncbi:unnamed protein product, partial [Penicillium nalgiovense]
TQNASEYYRRHNLNASRHSFPYHRLASPCQSQFGHCTFCGPPARPCKIRPRYRERLYSGHQFQALMDHVVVSMVFVALISALFPIFGLILVTYPKWLQENCTARFYYGCIQILVSLVVLSLGGYVASHVHGFQTSFEFFDGEGHFPYYKIMYYGAVGQAAFGSLVVILSLVRFFIADLRGH